MVLPNKLIGFLERDGHKVDCGDALGLGLLILPPYFAHLFIHEHLEAAGCIDMCAPNCRRSQDRIIPRIAVDAA